MVDKLEKIATDAYNSITGDERVTFIDAAIYGGLCAAQALDPARPVTIAALSLYLKNYAASLWPALSEQRVPAASIIGASLDRLLGFGFVKKIEPSNEPDGSKYVRWTPITELLDLVARAAK
jgi:hypothetical protein